MSSRAKAFIMGQRKRAWLIPCFVVVQADDVDDAVALASDWRSPSTDKVRFLFDEELPAAELSQLPVEEDPHTMRGIVPGIR